MIVVRQPSSLSAFGSRFARRVVSAQDAPCRVMITTGAEPARGLRREPRGQSQRARPLKQTSVGRWRPVRSRRRCCRRPWRADLRLVLSRSSAAESALVVLVAASATAAYLVFPISLGIAALLAIVVISYRQTVQA
jgi:hypothetical protein